MRKNVSAAGALRCTVCGGRSEERKGRKMKKRRGKKAKERPQECPAHKTNFWLPL